MDYSLAISVGQPRFNVGQVRDFSIIIPHRGHPLGLWATIHACEVDLAGSPYNYEYVVVVNGEPTVCADVKPITTSLEQQRKLGDLIHHPDPLSPPSARQLGAESAVGDLLFFFDNHCIVERGYFERAVNQFQRPEIDCLHSVTKYYVGTPQYHYRLSLENDFWVYGHEQNPVDPENPYRIAMAGHGGFVVRRSTFEEVGGFGPLQMFEGWAGEESYFDLKLALFGKRNWFDPKLSHYHFASEKRGYSKHYSDDFYRNLMVAAYVIGGETWLNRIYENFQNGPKQQTPHTIHDLYKQAVDRAEQHAEWLAQCRVKTLEQALAEFKAEGVAH